jgi:putative aldouronate transport system permease protein
MLPGIIYFLLFHYWPIINMRIAFYDFGLMGQQQFIGLQNFIDMFSSRTFYEVFGNTLLLSGLNILMQMVIVLTFALLLNEIRFNLFKGAVQTFIYLPHFLSWVVIASIFHLLLSPQTGIVNALIGSLGGKPVYFLGSEFWWRPVYLFILLWKDTGWGTVVFLAALSTIDPQLYEAADIDGAGKLKQVRVITLPHLAPTIVIVLIMSLAKILNLFHSVLVLYNPLVFSVSDVIETYVYRRGLVNADYDYATAIGIFKAVISFFLVLIANKAAKKIQGESII